VVNDARNVALHLQLRETCEKMLGKPMLGTCVLIVRLVTGPSISASQLQTLTTRSPSIADL